MKRRLLRLLCIFVAIFLVGCRERPDAARDDGVDGNQTNSEIQGVKAAENEGFLLLGPNIMELESGFSAVRVEGDHGFAEFLAQGGAASDADVAAFLTRYMASGTDLSFGGSAFGCSTLCVQDENGEWMFGRNFDWNRCEALIVSSVPENGYASISTVNTDFIQGVGFSWLPDPTRAAVALYAPLDGMNEKGLAVSVNMIEDRATIRQDTGKPDLTTTTAVRLLLDQAATAEEAVALLSEYDLHASMDYMVHFAIADAQGNSVVIEYIDNEMVVVETPVVTNFYLADGEKNGIGTAQSHTRYEILTERLEQSAVMSAEDVRDALQSVSKGNFGEFESTEWSVVFCQSTGTARYYHRENYDQSYLFQIG